MSKNKSSASKFFSLFGIIITVTIYILYNVAIPSLKMWRRFEPANLESNEINRAEFSEPTDKQKKELLLFWKSPWDDKNNWPSEGWEFGNCHVTFDRSYMRSARAVVFHYSAIRPKDLPWNHYRAPEQSFVWWSAENPVSVSNELNLPPQAFEVFDGFFNKTMTYRHDADIFWGYGTQLGLMKSLPRGKEVVDSIINKKTKLALWVVSNCGKTRGAAERMKFFKRMQTTGISLTLHGRCFDRQRQELNDDLYRAHKFYLAFENERHCRYYLTEKFWVSALGRDAVPVVWGAPYEDVAAAAPPHSFIHADKFESPEDLARHLDFLDRNNDEYRKYFKWRESDHLDNRSNVFNATLDGDEICDAIIDNSKTRIVESLYDAFFADNSAECLNSG